MKCPACDHVNLPGADHCVACQSDLDVPQPETGLRAALATETLGDLVANVPVLITPDTTLRDTVAKLAESGRHCALVVRDDALVGILTERDLLMKAALDYEEAADRPVEQFMTANPEVLGERDNLAYGLNRMTAGDYRHVPVVREGKPLGVVSVRDALEFMVRRHPQTLGTE